MTDQLKAKLESWLAMGLWGPTSSRHGSVSHPLDRDRLVAIFEEELAQGKPPSISELRRFLVDAMRVSSDNTDAICDVFRKCAHKMSQSYFN